MWCIWDVLKVFPKFRSNFDFSQECGKSLCVRRNFYLILLHLFFYSKNYVFWDQNISYKSFICFFFSPFLPFAYEDIQSREKDLFIKMFFYKLSDTHSTNRSWKNKLSNSFHLSEHFGYDIWYTKNSKTLFGSDPVY